MIKRETYSLLSLIRVYYDQFEVDQMKVDAWHEALKSFELEDIKKNLVPFVLHSPFPPKVADLISKTAAGSAIPTLDETKDIVKNSNQAVSAERIQWHLANMRKAIGLERG
jgi:replication initiation and membrane attachment protein DnaB